MKSVKRTQIDENVSRVCLRFMQDLDTPVSLGTYLLIKYGEWDQIAARRADPQFYLDTVSGTEKFRRDYQAVELLRKYEELPTSVDRKKVAEDGFWASEAQCCATNARLDHFLFHPVFGLEEVRIVEFIDDVKKLIAGILGPVPDSLQGRFGPGAVFESNGHPHSKKLVLGDKMEIIPTATAEAWPLALHTVLPTAWGRSTTFQGISTPFADPLTGSIVRGNRFTTVPKDCTKDRGICIEPGMNVFTQLGVGRHIRTRLVPRGVYLPSPRFTGDLGRIDLSQGQARHHELARLGSLTGEVATIDLSSASDTVARNLVKLLLPSDWYDLLDCLRSKLTWMKKGKRWVILEKFSSMGNGFTFELESLIFYALARVAVRGRPGPVSVYGDDIIVPTVAARDVLAVLGFFGFKANSKKTFVSGVFRESCGGDYFNGVLVTPYRLKNEPKQPSDWISLANGLWSWAGMAQFYFRHHPIARARRTALGCLPVDVRACTGPIRLGDLVIHAPRGTWKTKTRPNGITYGRVWRPVPVKVSLRYFLPDTQLALALYGANSAGLSPRNAVSGYRFGRVSFS